jgi:hypothetical protein
MRANSFDQSLKLGDALRWRLGGRFGRLKLHIVHW